MFVLAMGFHLSLISFFGFQVLCMSFTLWLTRKLLKFSWVKSLWISAGFTSALTMVILDFLVGVSLVVRTIILSLFPTLIVAVIMIIRTVVNCFGEMDDGGSVNSAERQRTLDMVEQGKITAEEGSELLEALGRSNAMLGQDKFSRLDMLILAGVALTVLGFFLPWAYIGKGIFQSGQHVGAEGWAVLIIAVLSAVPVFVTPKDMLYKISMLQVFLLLLGSALVISLMFRIGSSLGTGLPICMVGLVMASAACFGKFKKLAA